MQAQRGCSACGSNVIVGPHKVFGDGHIKIDLPGIKTATLVTFTCAHCGHVEFFVDAGGLVNIRHMINYNPQSRSNSQTSRCPSCTAAVKPGSKFCSNCGVPL